jgi:hypothetical protein
LNLSLLTYLAGGPGPQSFRRTDRRQERRISKRFPAGTIERLVAENVAGTPAAELGLRYGIAKSSVLWLVRQVGGAGTAFADQPS